ncbi:MAG TPA: PEP-CTERM sorting domain-containing protein, partial [Candidatus Sulfopaludibacter sp.]|nr:PEP-CTERM sorting domain-containing protein [Candidatus Sulfopaludibacter sp.]
PTPTPAYGDNVSQAADPNGFGFYGGAANTPDIALTYTSFQVGGQGGMTFWGGYSGNTALGLPFDVSTGEVALMAAPGFDVTLNSFGVGSDLGSTSNSLKILDASHNLLQDYSGTTFSNSAVTTISPGITSSEIIIQFTNWDTGLTGIDFSQSAVSSVPEPASFGLLGLGLALLGAKLRRRQRP